MLQHFPRLFSIHLLAMSSASPTSPFYAVPSDEHCAILQTLWTGLVPLARLLDTNFPPMAEEVNGFFTAHWQKIVSSSNYRLYNFPLIIGFFF
jgi:hypothetical protein